MNLTLRQVFVLTLAGLAVLLGVLFYVLMDGSRRSILQTSDRLRDEAARRIAGDVRAYLGTAEKALADVEGELKYAGLNADDPAALEAALFAQVRNNPRLAEATLTHADRLVYSTAGSELFRADGDRWQVSAYRLSGGDGGRVVTRRARREGDHFAVDVRDLPPGGALSDAAAARAAGTVPDPTEHPTFRTLVDRQNYGQRIWSDLHWSEFGGGDGSTATAPATAPAGPATVPAGPRRAEVTVQKAVADRKGRFLGVLRVGLLAEQIDDMTGPGAVGGQSAGGEPDPHRVFVCVSQGRLLSRVAADDRLEEVGDDVRVFSPHAPPEVAAALRLPALKDIRPGQAAAGQVDVGGRRFLVTFRATEEGHTQDWVVGVVAPEDYYLRGLTGTRNRLLAAALAVMAVILLGGVVTLRMIERGISRAAASAKRMQDFDFSPADPRAPSTPFRDVRAMTENLERAKTAMRAMGKYVPVDLVRRLYRQNAEPTLGGDLLDVTVMFTDIAGYTPLAEGLQPDDLALLLGDYFAAMTAAVHAGGGIVDKFIGDAVMALWNVPTPVDDHPARACAAALACQAASARWSEKVVARGLPPLVTRIGLNRATVAVGHFGAPDRMSYTALGDGVNVAARLEGLNKVYGTCVLATEVVRDAAAGAFRFRLLDRVIVKGKTHGVPLYELRGRADDVDPGEDRCARYEEALAAYWRREFAAAEAMLAGQVGADPPSAVLAERCRKLAADPPGAEWDGVFVATTK